MGDQLITSIKNMCGADYYTTARFDDYDTFSWVVETFIVLEQPGTIRDKYILVERQYVGGVDKSIEDVVKCVHEQAGRRNSRIAFDPNEWELIKSVKWQKLIRTIDDY